MATSEVNRKSLKAIVRKSGVAGAGKYVRTEEKGFGIWKMKMLERTLD